MKLRGRELLVLKEEQKKDNIEIKDNFDISVKNTWHRVKISFKRRVSSLEKYKKQFNPEHHCYRLSILDNFKEPVYVEERSITDFFGYRGFGKKKKSLDSICDAVLLEFLSPESGVYTLVFQLKTKEECSEINDVVLRVNEEVSPLSEESGVHSRIDLKKKRLLKNRDKRKRAKRNNNNLTRKLKMKKLISPSILSADFSKIGQEVKALENAGADYIHIDVMDGHFVPNITIGPLVVDAVKKITELPLDVHLMIENPDLYIEAFAKAGSDILTVHAEACYHLHRTIQAIKEKGIKAAVSLNPATPLNVLDHILEDVDMILIMTVNPGFGGQKFIRPMLQKTKDLKSKIEKAGLDIAIEVDGGIVLENIKEVSDLGADIFVSGSGILNTPDYGKTISEMKKIIG